MHDELWFPCYHDAPAGQCKAADGGMDCSSTGSNLALTLHIMSYSRTDEYSHLNSGLALDDVIGDVSSGEGIDTTYPTKAFSLFEVDVASWVAMPVILVIGLVATAMLAAYTASCLHSCSRLHVRIRSRPTPTANKHPRHIPGKRTAAAGVAAQSSSTC